MQQKQKLRVLVLDADMVPSLTICRSLSRRGCIVDAASHTLKPLTGYSNAVDAVLQYPDPLVVPELFVEWLLEHSLKSHCDLVIPVTERSLLALSNQRERLSHIKIAMPPAASLEVVLDKTSTLALAARVGVPIPLGITLSTLDDLDDLKQSLKFPVVVKPARSIGSDQYGATHLQVSYAFDIPELEASCARALRFGPLLLQEYFPGIGVGVELIARQGKILYAFQHRRLHEVPLTGGGSSLRKSEPVIPSLLGACERLIAALDWTGVAMVEFKLDPETHRFCLMEINGRFWGSLPLAVAAGADFPAMLLDLEMGGDLAPYPPYRDNIYCRLLSRDVHWYESVLLGNSDRRIVNIPTGWEVFKSLVLFLYIGHRFDVESIKDPVPGCVDIGRLLKSYFHRARMLTEEKVFFSRQRRAWRRGVVSSVVSGAEAMLFLCYGNINRSALADVLLRSYAEDAGISLTSAGFHPLEGRPADSMMIDVAEHYGVDMHAMRSTCVTTRLLHESDVIFVMEKSHYDRLCAMDASIADKVFLLGAHTSAAACSVEIADPYGHRSADYIACYKRIAEAVDNIKAIIAVRNIQ